MPQVQYIDLSKKAHLMKDVIIVISVHFHLSTLLWSMVCKY